MKRILKTVIVFTVIFVTSFRLLCFNSYAFVAAPAVIAADELGTIFAGLLSANGVPQEQIDGMSFEDKRVMVETGVNNGTLTPTSDYMNWLLSNNRENEIESGVKSPAEAAEAVSQGVNDWWNSMQQVGGNVADYLVPQPTNMHGFDLSNYSGDGACFVYEHHTGKYDVYVCEYITVNGNSVSCYNGRVFRYDKDGNLYQVQEYIDTSSAVGMNLNYYNPYFYGDVRGAEESGFAVSGADEYVAGYADGVPVTPEMINPDGTVTINGVTYYPSQYIDPSKLTDPALAALLAAIMAKLNELSVVQDVDVDVDVPEVELEIEELQKLKLKLNALKNISYEPYVQYLGIAFDEPNRFHNLSDMKRSPLVEFGVTEKDCFEICERLDLLSPIYNGSMRGGCWFCHFQPVEQLRMLRNNYPELWEILLKWDSDSPVPFKSDGHTVHDFDYRFMLEDKGYIPTKNFHWSCVNVDQLCF